jgi:hypothetical protein
MKPYKLTITAGALFASLALGTAAVAADLPKEGSFQGTYTSFGTAKFSKAGEHTFMIFDETGAQLTNGFADHVTFHCWGTGDDTNGITTDLGYCVGTDPAGDQLALQFSDEKHTDQEKSWKGSATLISGSGKFAGVSGNVTYVNHSREFRPLVEGTYVDYVTIEGRYKLP